MEKKQIETFIKKYNLGGAIEGVHWQNIGDNLSVTAMTSCRKLFVQVELEKGASFFKDVDIGIQDTSKLKKMLNPLGDNVAISLDIDDNDATRVRQLYVEDGKIDMIYVTAQKGTLDPIPKMKNIPTFGIEVILTPEFIDAFNKAFSAINRAGFEQSGAGRAIGTAVVHSVGRSRKTKAKSKKKGAFRG